MVIRGTPALCHAHNLYLSPWPDLKPSIDSLSRLSARWIEQGQNQLCATPLSDDRRISVMIRSLQAQYAQVEGQYGERLTDLFANWLVFERDCRECDLGQLRR